MGSDLFYLNITIHSIHTFVTNTAMVSTFRLRKITFIADMIYLYNLYITSNKAVESLFTEVPGSVSRVMK
jgi:hypothetical protein